MKYETVLRNHVVLPGREKALEKFLHQRYKGLPPHKLKNGKNSNSEDALTWSCFELLKSLSSDKKIKVLNEIWEDTYQLKVKSPFSYNDEIKIKIGETYTGSTTKESTEVDASIE